MAKGPGPRRPWNTASLAYWGASLGLGLAAFHCGHHIFVGDIIPNEDPFFHSLAYLLGGSLGGAFLLAGVSGFRNRIVLHSI